MTNRQLPIRGPFRGINSDTPSPESAPNEFDDVLNFFVRKGRIQTRPQLGAFTQGDPIAREIGSFKDANGNFHTFKLDNYISGQTPAYMLNPGGSPYSWSILSFPALASGQLGSNLPFATVYIANQVFFANGGYPLAYLDGSNSVQFTLDAPGTCRFLCVLANHLVQANCTEPAPGTSGSANFPRRVRWAASGNPQEWNPNTDFTAGVNDLLEVPDDITSINTMGYNAWVWRTNGLSVMYPTGIGLSPFDFFNYSLAPDGVGNFFPYSMATYTNWCTFVAQDNIYKFDQSTFTPLGGLSKKKIYADLANASGDQVWGRIIPNLTVGFDFLAYVLTIPGPNISWIYTFDDGQWVRFSSSQGYLTALRTVYTS